MPEPTVAIVGAGVAGAAAAIRLAERGVAVDLYEAVPEPRPIGAGLLLQPTGQRVLAAMGLLDEALALTTLLPDVAPLLAGLGDAAQLREARYADVWMSRWHDGRVLAIGDCAHGMSPQLGQGANMALIDAHELAAEVGGGSGDWPRVFERYSRRRCAHLRFYGQASRGLTPMFQSHAVVAPWLRDRFFGWGGRLPYIHQQSIATLAGVKTGWLWGRLKL